MSFKQVLITVVPPVECSDKQFRKWVAHRLGCREKLSSKNPLRDHELKAQDIDIR